MPWPSHSNDLIKKPEQTHSKRTHTLTRSASSPFQGAAERSSSSITYIFMSKDCFIHDADVHCAITVFKTIQKLHFPGCNTIRAQPDTQARTHPLLNQRCQVSHLSLATECRLTSNLTYSSSKKHRFVKHKSTWTSALELKILCLGKKVRHSALVRVWITQRFLSFGSTQKRENCLV